MAVAQKNCCPISSDITKNPKIGNGNEIISIRDIREIQEIGRCGTEKRIRGIRSSRVREKLFYVAQVSNFGDLGNSGHWKIQEIGRFGELGRFGEIRNCGKIRRIRKTGRFRRVGKFDKLETITIRG